MTWEGVPYFVRNAQHSAEVMRVVAYIGANGGEGVVSPTDCKVTASAIPDGNIHINPGAIACLNRFPGGASQAYVARNVGDEVKALTAQGSSGVRYDLIAMIVEDPQYAGQPAPASVTDGPYPKTAVYSNVPASTTKLSEVAPNQSGYALARVKFDISDGTVSPGDITDLRELAAPRTFLVKKTINGVATGSFPGALGVAPTGASWAVKVPSWARRATMEARWSSLVYTDTSSGGGRASGTAAVALGTSVSGAAQWQEDATAANKPVTGTIFVAEDIDVTAMAGTTQNLQARLAKTGGSGMNAQWTPYTQVVAEVNFYEDVA